MEEFLRFEQGPGWNWMGSNPEAQGDFGYFVLKQEDGSERKVPVSEEEYMEFIKYNDKRTGDIPDPMEDQRRSPNDLMGLIQGTGLRR